VEIGKVLADSESRERMTAQGLEPAIMSPEELRRYTREDVSRWSRLIKAAGIKQSGG
jgi:tripartite-type tricarboxylate transporter receptor subunit TctC